MKHRQSVIGRATMGSLLLWGAVACSPSLETVQGPAVLVTASSTERYSGQLVVVGDQVVYVSYQASNATNASVRRVPSAGGKEATIAANEGDIEELTTDGTNAYWMLREPTTFNRSIRAAPVVGGTATTLASGIPGIADVSDKCFLTDGGYLYFSSAGHGIRRMATSGGAITDLAPTQAAESCTLSAGWVYYKDQSNLFRVPVTGGTPQELAGGIDPTPGIELLVLGNSVYALAYASLFTFPATGGDIVPVTLGLQGARDLVSNGQYLYFNNIYTENMVRVGISDQVPSAFQTGISVGLAIDNTYVYWIGNGYQVMRGVQ